MKIGGKNRWMVRLPHAMTIPQLDGERNIGESLWTREVWWIWWLIDNGGRPVVTLCVSAVQIFRFGILRSRNGTLYFTTRLLARYNLLGAETAIFVNSYYLKFCDFILSSGKISRSFIDFKYSPPPILLAKGLFWLEWVGLWWTFSKLFESLAKSRRYLTQVSRYS